MPIQAKTFRSVKGRKVVLTSERLEHILLHHIEMKQRGSDLTDLIGKAVEDPDYVILGTHNEHIAIRHIEETEKHLIVPYDKDGEVKTAFITSKVHKIVAKRQVIWKR